MEEERKREAAKAGEETGLSLRSTRSEIVNTEEAMVVEAKISMAHDLRLPSPRITKPISVQGIRGMKTLFEEGTPLPAQKNFELFRENRVDQIAIPLYEGERWLADVIISGLDPRLPEGSVIDLKISLDKDYTGSATATVRATGQSVAAELEISRFAIPSLEEMDQDLEDVLEGFDIDII